CGTGLVVFGAGAEERLQAYLALDRTARFQARIFGTALVGEFLFDRRTRLEKLPSGLHRERCREDMLRQPSLLCVPHQLLSGEPLFHGHSSIGPIRMWIDFRNLLLLFKHHRRGLPFGQVSTRQALPPEPRRAQRADKLREIAVRRPQPQAVPRASVPLTTTARSARS